MPETLILPDLDVMDVATLKALARFADGKDAGPKLNEAQILPTGRFEQIKPQPVKYGEAIGGKFSDGFVTIEGQVLSQLHNEISA